MKKKVMQI